MINLQTNTYISITHRQVRLAQVVLESPPSSIGWLRIRQRISGDTIDPSGEWWKKKKQLFT